MEWQVTSQSTSKKCCLYFFSNNSINPRNVREFLQTMKEKNKLPETNGDQCLSGSSDVGTFWWWWLHNTYEKKVSVRLMWFLAFNFQSIFPTIIKTLKNQLNIVQKMGNYRFISVIIENYCSKKWFFWSSIFFLS